MNHHDLQRTGHRFVIAILLLTVAAPFAVQAKDPTTPEVVIGSAISIRPAQPLPKPPPTLVAASALVMDVNTGRIFYEKNADQHREVASTQKLMTALLVCETGDLDGLLTVDVADTRVVPSKLYLKAGEQHPRGILLKTLMIKSANDVACCLARDNAGSIEAFIDKMNKRAQQLGMVDSHFLSPNGLSEEGQYSSARDMARLARQAYRHPVIRDAVCTKVFPYCNGLKTGFTNAAGKCLISSGQKDGAEVIAVVLGSTPKLIWKDSQSLLHWALGVDDSKEQPLPTPKDKPEEE
jgi:serine-type D-Ala-D-Ala carboxypeptidase (penicillin-binding protein 5/6)